MHILLTMHKTIPIMLAALLCVGTAEARIPRSQSAKNAFAHTHPCPSTGRRVPHCPGYVIDHVKPLACGGADAPSNMQWQSVAAAKAKDRWELKACGR